MTRSSQKRVRPTDSSAPRGIKQQMEEACKGNGINALTLDLVRDRLLNQGRLLRDHSALKLPREQRNLELQFRIINFIKLHTSIKWLLKNTLKIHQYKVKRNHSKRKSIFTSKLRGEFTYNSSKNQFPSNSWSPHYSRFTYYSRTINTTTSFLATIN